MSKYLRDRFPLDDTSTVYMSGRGVYNLVRWNRPGIIAPVELYPADAEKFREAVREAMAEAWNEGWNAAVDSEGFPGDINPYRIESQETP